MAGRKITRVRDREETFGINDEYITKLRERVEEEKFRKEENRKKAEISKIAALTKRLEDFFKLEEQ